MGTAGFKSFQPFNRCARFKSFKNERRTSSFFSSWLYSMAWMLRKPRPRARRFPGHVSQGVLDQVDFPRFKKRFSALCAYPRGHSVPRDVITVTVQTKRSRTELHSPFAMNTFHILAPLSKIFRPLVRIREICGNYSQIFVLGEHTTCTAPNFSGTKHQTAGAAKVVRIILNQVALSNYGFHFGGAYHTLWPRHLTNSMG